MKMKVVYIFVLLIIILSLLSVAFYTLMERKIMSINQFRVGPNKIMFLGFVQPIFDGFKLFLKMLNSPSKNNIIFYLSPVISFFVSIMFWSFFFMFNNYFKNLMLLLILGLSIFSFILSGWSSFSKFGYLGGVRASSQTVSYEVSLAILLLGLIYFFNNFNINYFYENYLYILLTPLMLCWFISLISETNRAPFDFSEGESELISGFNIEYGSSGFVLFFLSEYSMMIFFSLLTMNILNMNIFYFLLILFLFISLRTSFPRFRYDFLQEFLWLKMLPFICCFFILIIFI